MAAPAFRTDVTIRAPASQNLLDRPNQSRGQTSSEYLDAAAESANKHIDNDVKQMLDAFEAVMGLSRIRDKDKFRIAQENFELEGRADVMVRAAQSLTLLSHSLKLSLLFSQEPIDGTDGQTLDEEAISLIQSTSKSKEECTRLMHELFGLGETDNLAADESGENETTTRQRSSSTEEQQQGLPNEAQERQAADDQTMAEQE